MSLIALDIDEVLLDCISRLNDLAKQLFNANITAATAMSPFNFV